MCRQEGSRLLCFRTYTDHAIKLDTGCVGEHALDHCFCIGRECSMIREGMDGVALILISKEKADQFCCTSIAVQTCTNRFKIDLARSEEHTSELQSHSDL